MKQYHDLLRTILKEGSYKAPAREGMPGTLSLFGYQNRYDLSDGFPILTTKKVKFSNIFYELIWFLRGDSNVKFLVDHDCNIWNQDAYNYLVKQCELQKIPPIQFNEFEGMIKSLSKDELKRASGYFTDYVYGDCGYQYGKVWRDWDSPRKQKIGTPRSIDQLTKVIENIRTKPFDRRKLVTAVDPAHDEDLALYWCHSLFQFNCRALEERERREIWAKKMGRDFLSEFDSASKSANSWDEYFDSVMKADRIPKYYLDCQMYQRSADVFLGVPYNVSSYCLLTHIVAKMCNMVPGRFIHTFGDVHIYDNHREQVDEILTRDPEKYKLPRLMIPTCEWSGSLDEVVRQLEITPIFLEGYDSYPAIKAELSTGMKK